MKIAVPRCSRCDAPATFDSPRDYCDEHWARWWGGFDAEGPSKLAPSEEAYREALERVRSLPVRSR